MKSRALLRLATAVAVITAPVSARPASADSFVESLQSMMAELRPHSRRDARTIQSAYGPMVTRTAFINRGDLESALEVDELALVPEHTAPLNITLRLDGAHPIAEKDLLNQGLYVGARPAALGLLYEIAARVESGPIEVTSLVRHLQYQRALGATNGNARTEVPTHAMGLAFDIALVNTPLARAYEIRDVLRAMRDAGTLYFIGESQQLVFHVVPTPSWIGYFDALHLARQYAPGPAPSFPLPSAAALRGEIPAPQPVELPWWF